MFSNHNIDMLMIIIVIVDFPQQNKVSVHFWISHKAFSIEVVLNFCPKPGRKTKTAVRWHESTLSISCFFGKESCGQDVVGFIIFLLNNGASSLPSRYPHDLDKRLKSAVLKPHDLVPR